MRRTLHPVRSTAGRGRPGVAATAAGGAGAGLILLARLVQAIVSIVVGIIVIAIALRLLGANSGNDLVRFFHDTGRTLVGPFDGLFTLDDRKLEMVVDWGLAALAWSIVGGVIARALAGAGLAGTARRRG